STDEPRARTDRSPVAAVRSSRGTRTTLDELETSASLCDGLERNRANGWVTCVEAQLLDHLADRLTELIRETLSDADTALLETRGESATAHVCEMLALRHVQLEPDGTGSVPARHVQLVLADEPAAASEEPHGLGEHGGVGG